MRMIMKKWVRQVHKAKLKYSGAIVAVKVQYPDSLDIMLQASSFTQWQLHYMSLQLAFDRTYAHQMSHDV